MPWSMGQGSRLISDGFCLMAHDSWPMTSCHASLSVCDFKHVSVIAMLRSSEAVTLRTCEDSRDTRDGADALEHRHEHHENAWAVVRITCQTASSLS